MTFWDFADKHPILTFLLGCLIASCIPSISYVRKIKDAPNRSKEP